MKAQRVNGRFYSESEPNTFKLTLRMPESLAQEMKQAAGVEMAAWVRDAIAEKVAREKQLEEQAGA